MGGSGVEPARGRPPKRLHQNEKEAVRRSERPKSREETPVVGYGNAEVHPSSVMKKMPVFASDINASRAPFRLSREMDAW